jgi:hypothetical protein
MAVRSAARRAPRKLYSNKPAAVITVDEILAQRGLGHPASCRRLTDGDRAAVEAVAQVIAAEVDHLMATRWSRSEGLVLEQAESQPAVSTAGCACGSGIPVTTVQVGGQSVHLMALEPLLELAYGQGLRAGGELPADLLASVRIYNEFPTDQEAHYTQAVEIAWRAFCAAREATHG